MGGHEEPFAEHDEHDARGCDPQTERVGRCLDPHERAEHDDIENHGTHHDGGAVLDTAAQVAEQSPVLARPVLRCGSTSSPPLLVIVVKPL